MKKSDLNSLDFAVNRFGEGGGARFHIGSYSIALPALLQPVDKLCMSR